MIRQLRLAKGLTLEGLAARVGCVKGYLSAIERGKRPPPETELAERLERELSTPTGIIVRASAWSRTPAPVRAEVLAAREGREAGAGDLKLTCIAGWAGAQRVVVVTEDVDISSIQRGDVVVLGAAVAELAIGLGRVVAVEGCGGTRFLRWSAWNARDVRGRVVAIRPVLGVCRVF
jgi:transcriptional regulator with XRE-family HTH domain